MIQIGSYCHPGHWAVIWTTCSLGQIVLCPDCTYGQVVLLPFCTNSNMTFAYTGAPITIYKLYLSEGDVFSATDFTLYLSAWDVFSLTQTATWSTFLATLNVWSNSYPTGASDQNEHLVTVWFSFYNIPWVMLTWTEGVFLIKYTLSVLGFFGEHPLWLRLDQSIFPPKNRCQTRIQGK